jgi:exodeoxyribonuclease VII small subunit
MSEIEDLSFEEAFAELEELVQQLEAGDLTLDQAMALFERGTAMALFERGTALATQCNDRLDAAELRVQQLLSTPGEHPPGEGHELAPFEEYRSD